MIKEYYSGDYTQGELSEKYDVTYGCVNDILNCKTWRHIERRIE